MNGGLKLEKTVVVSLLFVGGALVRKRAAAPA